MSKSKKPKTIRGQMARAQDMVDLYRQRTKISRMKRHGELLKNSFWALLLLTLVLIAGFMIYNNQERILNVLKSFEAKAAVTQEVPVQGCLTLNLQVIEGGRLQLNEPIPKVGACYNVPMGMENAWKSEFSDQEIARFAKYIFDKSDGSMPLEVIVEKLKQSTSTWTLDLRTTQVQPSPLPPTQVVVTEPTATFAPTEVPPTPTPEPTATPAPTPTPSVIAVPWPEKERGFSLEELARVMTDHNIKTVAGENKGTTPQDRTNWALYYPVSEGVQDYVVFKMLNSPLPTTCVDGSSVTLSLLEIADPASMKISAGAYDLYFVCK